MRHHNSHRRTRDFSGEKYSPELIRQLEDPEYAKAAEKYERESRRAQANPSRSRSNGKTSSKRQYKLNKWKVLRNILFLLILLVAVCIGLFYHYTGNFDKQDTSSANFGIDSGVKEDLSDYRNIAILGVDARANEGFDGSRTDAIIVMSINKKNGDIKLISVMRDSYLQMNYKENDERMIMDKITHAHHYLGGVNTCAALNRNLDLNIDEYVIFNWKSVSDAVDCFDGVKIDVKEDEINDMNHYGYETAANVAGTYTPIESPGVQTLNGVQATTYCRIRKTSGGDEGRSNRYKKVVTAVLKAAMKNPTKIGKLSETVFPNVRTNMSQTDMLTALLRAPGYDIKGSVSWPYDYYSGLLRDGVAYVVPKTLESNVIRLHEEAFDQKGYTPSDTSQSISQLMRKKTGI